MLTKNLSVPGVLPLGPQRIQPHEKLLLPLKQLSATVLVLYAMCQLPVASEPEGDRTEHLKQEVVERRENLAIMFLSLLDYHPMVSITIDFDCPAARSPPKSHRWAVEMLGPLRLLPASLPLVGSRQGYTYATSA